MRLRSIIYALPQRSRRYSLWRMALFVTCAMWIVVAISLASIYWLSVQPIEQSRRNLLNQHLQQLQLQLAQSAPAQWEDVITASSSSAQGVFSVIQTRDGQIFGALDQLPVGLPFCPSLKEFPVWGEFVGDIALFEGCMMTHDGHQIVVASSKAALNALKENFINAAMVILLLAFFLSFIPSFYIRRKIMRYLANVDDVFQAIERGDFKRRIPVSENQDEWDELASNINKVLHRVESSITQIQSVTDAIAHDLRTPLTHLTNQLNQLEHNSMLPTETIAPVQKELQDLIATLNAMLELSRLEHGDIRHHFRPLDIAQIVQDAIELIEPQLEQKQQTLSYDLRALYVDGEASLLFRAVFNLLENAHKHTPSGTHIFVRIEKRKLIISDTGDGIPTHLYERVFERLYRRDKSRATPGHGLGLALVAASFQAHDAQISLSHTDHKNQRGLCVTVTFV